MTTKFLRKPHEVRAIQATRKNYGDLKAFVKEYILGAGVMCSADAYVIMSEPHEFRHEVPILSWFVIEMDDERPMAHRLRVYAHDDFCARFTPIGV